MSCTMLVNDIRQEFNVLITLAEVINNPSVLQLEYFINNYNSENHNVIDNYAEDVELLDDPKISSKNLPDLKFPNSNGTLFLTGATGFLGAHILATYLEKNPLGKVYCLVRGKNDKEAMRRLKQNNQTYMTWKDSWNKGENQNVIAICGDLSKEKFGLSSHQWYRLCHDVDLIIHSGAMVHWIYPYAQLKPINVLSTIQCLTMASTHHLKPFYFVSSVSVLNNMEFLKKTNSGETVIIQENDDLESSRTGLLNGYGQSKWVSEKLIMKAIERGIPACIIRPGFILGHSQNGMLNTDDFIIRMMAGCAQLKLFPDISSILNTCPVDYVASAIIRIASQEKWLSHNVYHMWNTPCISFNDIFEEMQLHGYNIKKVNYEEWCQTLKELNINHALENNALYPLLHFVLNDLTASSNTPLLNDDNTREA
ncbi:male sterility protein-domain-containing protein, partial [Neocallimastix sp. 'constans']